MTLVLNLSKCVLCLILVFLQIVHLRERYCMWGVAADTANPLQDMYGKLERIWLNKWEKYLKRVSLKTIWGPS